MSTNKERLVIYVSKELKEKLKKASEDIGISMTSYISVIISERIRQDEAIDVIEFAKKLTELQVKN